MATHVQGRGTRLAACALMPLLLAACAQKQPVVARAPEAQKTQDEQLQRAIVADAKVKEAVATRSSNLEADLTAAYSGLQELCKARFDSLDRDQERYAKAEARTNVIGALVALLGSVTVYAPGKTLLMGMGVSSSSSGTVSSGITQFFSSKSAADRATLVALKNQLENAFDRYDLLDRTNDPDGSKRSRVLSRAKGICLGLTPGFDPGEPKKETKEAPAATPAAAGASVPSG